MVMPMWCSAARLDVRKKGKRSGIAVVVVIITIAVVSLKGKPYMRHAPIVEHVFPLVLEIFSSWEYEYLLPFELGLRSCPHRYSWHTVNLHIFCSWQFFMLLMISKKY